MKYRVLSYVRWWRLESQLNQRLPGEDPLPLLDSFQVEGERLLKEILGRVGKEKSDWEVAYHYQRYPVLYSYIHKYDILSHDVLAEIAELFPSNSFSWYAQLELYDTESRLSGMIIIRNHEAIFNAEDSILPYFSEMIGIGIAKAHMLKFVSRLFSFPSHAISRFRIWKATRNL